MAHPLVNQLASLLGQIDNILVEFHLLETNRLCWTQSWTASLTDGDDNYYAISSHLKLSVLSSTEMSGFVLVYLAVVISLNLINPVLYKSFVESFVIIGLHFVILNCIILFIL